MKTEQLKPKISCAVTERDKIFWQCRSMEYDHPPNLPPFIQSWLRDNLFALFFFAVLIFPLSVDTTCAKGRSRREFWHRINNWLE